MLGAWWMRQAYVIARRLVSALLWAPGAAFWNLDWLCTGLVPHPETHQQRLVLIVVVGEHYGAGPDNHRELHAWAAGLRAQGLALVALAWALAGEWAACLASAAAPHPVNAVQRSSLQGTRYYDASCLFARPALQDSLFSGLEVWVNAHGRAVFGTECTDHSTAPLLPNRQSKGPAGVCAI